MTHFLGIISTNYFPNGYMYSEFPIEFDESFPSKHNAPKELSLAPIFKNSDDKKWKLSRRALADRQQDIYSINVNGIFADFVIGKDGQVLFLNDAKLKIEYTTNNMLSLGIRSRINSFTLTDVGGIVYKFNAYDLSEVGNVEEISREGDNNLSKVRLSTQPTGQFTIQRWLLTEIYNPQTTEKIIFEYQDYLVDYISAKVPSYTIQSQGANTVQVFEQRTRGKLKQLKKIIYPDRHQV